MSRPHPTRDPRPNTRRRLRYESPIDRVPMGNPNEAPSVTDQEREVIRAATNNARMEDVFNAVFDTPPPRRRRRHQPRPRPRPRPRPQVLTPPPPPPPFLEVNGLLTEWQRLYEAQHEVVSQQQRLIEDLQRELSTARNTRSL